MVIDVSVIYDGRNVMVRSEAADYSETRLAIIGLSKERFGEAEVVECIGEILTPKIEQSFWERDKGSRTYRFIDPFLLDNFEPDAAFAIVRHLCYLAHGNIKPPRSIWREVLRLDRFKVKIKLPGYSRIPIDRREQFEGNLRQRFRRYDIEE